MATVGANGRCGAGNGAEAVAVGAATTMFLTMAKDTVADLPATPCARRLSYGVAVTV
jgi:hypothetical protein